ncbi:MAG TPA: GNAT family N-acetyltransferase [Bradyrhizobium sp.]|nr:GNAT family N-acetyltransferase [Bradyrhizobium sp.]
MAGNIVSRSIGENEREAWNPLWAGYLAFYKSALRPEISDLTWDRFHDPDEQIFALGGYVDGELMAIAHYLFHRSTWAPDRYCYLEDLFVAPAARGRGLGRALIEAVYQKARVANASRVYWLTQSDNTQARILYDKVADNLGFIQYRKVI